MNKTVALITSIFLYFSGHAWAQYGMPDLGGAVPTKMPNHVVECGSSMQVTNIYLKQCRLGYTEEDAMQNLPKINQWEPVYAGEATYSCKLNDCLTRNPSTKDGCQTRFNPIKTPKLINKKPTCTEHKLEETVGNSNAPTVSLFWRCCWEATVNEGTFSCTSCLLTQEDKKLVRTY